MAAPTTDGPITGLTANTSPAQTDILYSVKDPAGTPLDRKVAFSDVYKALFAAAPSAGSIAFITAAGFTEDNTNLYWETTANSNFLRIGAGTSPGEIRLLEGSGGGTNYVALLAPATVGANVSFTLPGTDLAGVMVSNGSGALSLSSALTLAQGTLTASTPFINHTATWNNAGVTFTNILSNVTNTTSGAASLLMDLQIGGSSYFSVSKGGTMTAVGNAVIGAAGTYNFSGRAKLSSSADGILTVSDTAGTSFSRLTFGGTTSSFPAIKRNSAALNFRLADDSADAAITSGQLTASGALLPSSNDVAAIGVSGTAWSDLFLASGGVINWDAGDVTLSHSAANRLRYTGTTSLASETGGFCIADETTVAKCLFTGYDVAGDFGFIQALQFGSAVKTLKLQTSGGALSIGSTSTITSMLGTTASTSGTTGALTVAGGLGVAGSIYTNTGYGSTVNGLFTSTVADGAGAVGFQVKTSSLWTTAGAILLKATNNTSDMFSIDKSGNMFLRNIAPASGTGTINLPIATAASSVTADSLNIGAKDSSVGSANSTLAIYAEQAVEAIGTFTPTQKVRIWWNGVEYWIQLDPV